MEEKKRKSSRSFELEKGGKRSFDLQKTSARKFDLSKDSDEASLEELKKDLLAAGKIDAEEVNKLREVLFADGKIDQEEADFLFEINDAVSGKPNDSSWKAFFVEAISDYLLNDEKSPGVIDEDEGKWLEAKINNDGKLDTVERALVASLRRKSKSMPKSLGTVLAQVASRFNLKKDEVPAAEAAAAMAALAATKGKASRFSLEKENNDAVIINMEQLKKIILYDGKIDREEVERLRKTLYADGKIDQEEADFLFELNDAVSGKKNDPAWNQFFVQAISDYLLNDEKSPGVIDEKEGKWLVEKIGADRQVDGVEKQLISHLKKHSKKMPTSVEKLLGGNINSHGSSTSSKESTSDDLGSTSSKKWLWIILAIVMAVAIAYFCIKSCNGNKEGQTTEQLTSSTVGENNEQETHQDSAIDNSTNQEASDVEGEFSDSGTSSESGISESVDNSIATEVKSSPQKTATIEGENNDNHASSSVSSPSTPVNQSSAPVQSTTARSQQVVLNASAEETALNVIRGIYGNGLERKQNLGDRYAEIQSVVNDMYRKGLVR